MAAPMEAQRAERHRCSLCGAVFRIGYTLCPNDGAHLVAISGDPLVGMTIADRYLIEEPLGEGSMGMVYRARHVRLSRKFAVKVLFGDLTADATMRLRFANEAEAACQLDHPNVVSVLDFGLDAGGVLYLAMTYVDGECLRDVVHREAPIDPARALSLLAQIADGLDHAHSHAIIHRDLKPENVLVQQKDGREIPYVLDFGLAISTDEDNRGVRLTGGGVMLGTPSYMSPEQIEQRPLDGRSDLFGLGVMAYEMLTGQTPFDGGSLEIVSQIASRRPPALRERNPAVDVPRWLEAIVMRLLARRPEDRFRSAAETAEVLRAAVSALANESSWVPPGEAGGITLDEFLASHIERDTGEVCVEPDMNEGVISGELVIEAADGDDGAVEIEVVDSGEEAIAIAPEPRPRDLAVRARRRKHRVPLRVALWMTTAVTFLLATAHIAEALAIGAPVAPKNAIVSDEHGPHARYPVSRRAHDAPLILPH